jgi:hypothetical protein
MTRRGSGLGAAARRAASLLGPAVLSAGIAPACGGRTSILSADYETYGGPGPGGAGASQFGTGGSGGTAAVGGMGTAAAGAGSAAGPEAGSAGAQVGGSGAGSPMGHGGTAGTDPGPGGTGGTGGTGAGGTGGGAEAATGGGGGSPALYAACEQACKGQPSACVGSQSATCDFSCGQISTQFAGCQGEITDYFRCLSGVLDPGAVCRLTQSGDCLGDGCTKDATDRCASLLQAFADCEAGCATRIGTAGESCDFERACPSHDYLSHCEPGRAAGTDYECSCSIDGREVETFTVSATVRSPCADADAQCAAALP